MEVVIILILLVILIKMPKPTRAKRKPPTDYSGDDWGW